MASLKVVSLATRGHEDITSRGATIAKLTRHGQHFNVGSTSVPGTIEFELGVDGVPTSWTRAFQRADIAAHEKTCRDGNGRSHLQPTSLPLC